MVECLECGKDFKAIVEFHLRFHDMTFREYREKYPDAKIIDDYECENCDELVTHAKSKRGKYCTKCAKIIKNIQITLNARQHNRKKKKMNEVWYGDANREWGLMVDENSQQVDRIRLSHTHAGWDTDVAGKTVLGTFTDSSLKVNEKTGRIKQAERLRRDIQKLKNKSKRK